MKNEKLSITKVVGKAVKLNEKELACVSGGAPHGLNPFVFRSRFGTPTEPTPFDVGGLIGG